MKYVNMNPLGNFRRVSFGELKMTKRELIEALEALEVEDTCAVFVLATDGSLLEIEIVGLDQQGDVILSEELGK